MSALPVVLLIILAILTWAVAIWASNTGEPEEPRPRTSEQEEPKSHSFQGRKAA